MSSESLSAAISTLLARHEIADLAQHWGRARDQGRWEDLARTFHPGGRIKVMWFEGTHEDFIAACAKRFGASCWKRRPLNSSGAKLRSKSSPRPDRRALESPPLG